MNTYTFEDYIQAFKMEGLHEEDQIASLQAFAKAVHTQFLMNLYEDVGEENFNAIKASISLGAPIYATTLKHLAPEYMKTFERTREELIEKMKE